MLNHSQDIDIDESEREWKAVANRAATKAAKNDAKKHRRGLAGDKERTELKY